MKKDRELIKKRKYITVLADGKTFIKNRPKDLYYNFNKIYKSYDGLVLGFVKRYNKLNIIEDIYQEFYIFIYNKLLNEEYDFFYGNNAFLYNSINWFIKDYIYRKANKNIIIGSQHSLKEYNKLTQIQSPTQEEKDRIAKLKLNIYEISGYDKSIKLVENKTNTIDLSILESYLTDEEFILLRDYYIEEYSTFELANLNNCSTSALKKRRQRILLKLREALLDDGYDLDDLLSSIIHWAFSSVACKSLID